MKSDMQLKTDVLDEIQFRPNIEAEHIGVTAKSGVVTLTGQVPHYSEKLTAEDAAKSVHGVKAVANDIEVVMIGSMQHTDQDIATAALNAMKWDYEVPTDKIMVVVKNGAVTLSGSLDWQYQKDAAARCVRYLGGVTTVSNDIAIKSKAMVGDVKSKIENAFRRHADLDAKQIKVDTKDGKVTLSGNVSSWSDRSDAVWAAWSAPGVSSVKDNLLISV